jgi:hypothetical protein
MPTRHLTWKWEEGFEDGETPIGPAWIATLNDDGARIGDLEEVAGGAWIPRADAIKLAEENGYEVFLDE